MTGNEHKARKLAESFRAEHDLGEGPIKDMFELVHVTAGIDVLSLEAGEAEHGLSMLDPGTGLVAIAVAVTSHPMRQRSSIAHELGHVLAGDLSRDVPLVPGERGPEEIQADAFGRYLLLPVAAVVRRLGNLEVATLTHLSELVQEFEVSPQLAAIQMRTAGIIDASTCATWSKVSSVQLATSNGWLNQYRGLANDSSHPRAPQRLMSMAVDGYLRGVVDVGELARWYGQNPDELVEQLGSPSPASVDDTDDFWGDNTPLFPAPPESA